MWLGTLLMEQSEDIYRMKGLMSIDGMDERFVFQVIVPLNICNHVRVIELLFVTK